MARVTIVETTDDIDGTANAETVTFALNGTTYEIDLGKKNWDRLQLALSPFINAATKVSSRAGAAKRSSGRTVNDKAQNAAIREWAIRKGFDVAPRGRIKAEIVDQYHREAGR